MIVVPFTIAEDDINLLGTITYTLITLPASTTIRVPHHIEICRVAGTAYAITRTYVPPTQAVPTVDANRDFIKGYDPAAEYIILREKARAGGAEQSQRPLFYIPMDPLLFDPLRNSMLLFPVLDGRRFTQGDTTYELRATTPISGGTGALKGNIFFEEYPIYR